MALLVAGALLLAVGGSALAGSPALTPGDSDGGIPGRAVDMGSPSSGIRPEAGGAGGGVIGTRQTSQAGGLNGGVVGSRSGTDTVLAGGLRGGVVLATDTAFAGEPGGFFGDMGLAGGRGGIGGDCNW